MSKMVLQTAFSNVKPYFQTKLFLIPFLALLLPTSLLPKTSNRLYSGYQLVYVWQEKSDHCKNVNCTHQREQTKRPKLSTKTVRTRFAPTPSGYLHLGNVLSFAITWAWARQRDGHVALRIDDLDSTRFRPEYVQDIFDTLYFMGINYDEGPTRLDDFTQHHSQQNKTPQYQVLIDRLACKQLVYACTCSRSQILASSPTGMYMRHCLEKQIPLYTHEAAWRVLVPEKETVIVKDMLLGDVEVLVGKAIPDFVLRRKDGIPAYQIASLADDLAMGINFIVRGKDLLESTAAQLFLAQRLGETEFVNVQFLHHPLLLNPQGYKLSKSKGDTSIYMLRKQGLSAAKIWNMLASHLNLKSNSIRSSQDFLDSFELESLRI
jgi:glutamyl/glutaminyl-tRNA synthetase